MKKKSLFKRLSSVALAFLLSLSALTQGITASAFSDKKPSHTAVAVNMEL